MARRWGILGILGAVALSLALAGCTVQGADGESGSGTNMPADPTQTLQVGDGGTSLCADSAGGGERTFGTPITNTGDSALTLTGTVVDTTMNATLIGTAVLPADGDDAVNTTWSADYPPVLGDDLPEWSTHVPVAGYVLDPGSSAWVAWVIGLDDESTAGSIGGLRVTYRDGDADLTSDVAVVQFGIAPAHDCGF